MATEKTLYKFVVYAPDYADSEGLSRRLAARPNHLEAAAKLKEKGLLKLGGALISPDTYQTAEKKMAGSMMIYEAESLEAVRELVENDPYWVGNVWDKEKTTIMPFAGPVVFP